MSKLIFESKKNSTVVWGRVSGQTKCSVRPTLAYVILIVIECKIYRFYPLQADYLYLFVHHRQSSSLLPLDIQKFTYM